VAREGDEVVGRSNEIDQSRQCEEAHIQDCRGRRAEHPATAAASTPIGQYDPRQEPSFIEIDAQKASEWLKKGVQPSRTVKRLLAIKGIDL